MTPLEYNQIKENFKPVKFLMLPQKVYDKI